MAKNNSGRGFGEAALKVAKKPIAIATRCSAHHLGTALAGTVAGVTYRYKHVMRTPSRGIQFVYANNYPTATSESSNANDITVGCAIEYNGQIARMHFNGASTRLIGQGGQAITDIVYMDIPEGATFYSRTWVSVPVDTNTYPQGISLDAAQGDGRGVGNTLQTAGALSASTESGFGPSVIVGVPIKDDAVAVALFGDSIVANTAGLGWPVSLVEGNYGYSIISRPSSTVNSMQANTPNQYRMRFSQYFTHAIVNFGTNDFNGAPTLDAQEVFIKGLWKSLKDQGLKVYHSTTMPRSTGTFATTAGQTVYNTNSYNDKRRAFNDRLRRGEYALDGVLDVSDAVEDVRDSGIWKAGLTADGIHPNYDTTTFDKIKAVITFRP
jgi:hypothetical protein